MFAEVRDNEFTDLVQKGWLEQGTGVDLGKYRLSAKGLEQYNRLMESLEAKSQVLVELKVLANAYQTVAAVKAFMK